MDYKHEEKSVFDAIGVPKEMFHEAIRFLTHTINETISQSRCVEQVLEFMSKDEIHARATVLVLVRDFYERYLELAAQQGIITKVLSGISGKEGEKSPIADLGELLGKLHEADPEKCAHCDEREDCPMFREMMDKNLGKEDGTIQ